MSKSRLRAETIEKLKKLSEADRQMIEGKLREYLISSSQWEKSEVIALTISQGFEWSTEEIIKEAWGQGKTIVVPRCEPKDKKLHFYKFTSYDELETVYYQLKEPKEDPDRLVAKASIDLIIVPGLVFDPEGYRIGFGGGYYDRFLSDYEGITISLASGLQIVPKVPKESFDIPVNNIITETGFIKPD